MPWPPVIPVATRTNATPQLDAHPADHNAISQALTDVVAQVNPTAWTALPLGTGWSNSGGPYQVAQYRKIGDVVQLRGIVAVANAATQLTIATLPPGFRLLTQSIWLCWSLTAPVRIDVNPSGIVSLQGGLTGAITYTGLNTIIYSTL